MQKRKIEIFTPLTADQLISALHSISPSDFPREVFKRIIHMTALSLAQVAEFDKTREEEFMSIGVMFKGASREQVSELVGKLIFSIGSEGSDYLGRLYMEANWGDKQKCQVFTPSALATSMVKMVTPDPWKALKERENQDRPMAIADFCCGGGVFLFAHFQHMMSKCVPPNLLLYIGADLDALCSDMAFIQCAVFGIPAVIYNADTLEGTIYSRWFTPAFMRYGYRKEMLGNDSFIRNVKPHPMPASMAATHVAQLSLFEETKDAK